MRVATLILGLILSGFMAFQSVTLMALSGIGQNISSTAAHKAMFMNDGSMAAAGLLVAILTLIGAVFALKMPKVSAFFFILGTIFAVLLANVGSTTFGDMNIYAVVLAIFTIMMIFSVKARREEIRQKKAMLKFYEDQNNANAANMASNKAAASN